MPASMSAGAADALAERERRLVDELADDPAEHQAGRVADPGGVLAERGEEALGGRRRPTSARVRPAGQLDERASARAAAARGSRPRRRPGRARPASPRRSRSPAGRPAAAPRAPRRPAVEDQERQLARRASLGRAHVPAGIARRASPQLVRERRVAGDHDHGRRRRRSARAARGRRGRCRAVAVVVVAASGLAPVPAGGDHPRRRSATGASAARRSSARRTSARCRGRRRRRRGPSARTGPSGSRRRSGRCGRSPRAARSAPAASRSASSPNGRLQRLTRKPGPSAASITCLPIASPVARATASAALADSLAGDDLEQRASAAPG